MIAAVDDVRPERLQPEARGGEMDDRAVESLQRVAQGSGDAGALQGGVDEANVDLQGAGLTWPAAEQRRQRGVLLRGELAETNALDGGVGGRAFKALAHALAQRGEPIVAEQTLKACVG